MKIAKPKSTTELRDQLADMFAELRGGKINREDAKEINNTAGKILKSIYTQLEMAKINKCKVNIPFNK